MNRLHKISYLAWSPIATCANHAHVCLHLLRQVLSASRYSGLWRRVFSARTLISRRWNCCYLQSPPLKTEAVIVHKTFETIFQIMWRRHNNYTIVSIVKPTRCTNVSVLFSFIFYFILFYFILFYFILFAVTLYMFRTVIPSISSSSRLYIQQQAFVKQNCCLLASKQTAVLFVTVCTVLNCWWWTEWPSETCRVLLQSKINFIHWCIWLVLL